jgi:hypothetical protein
MVNCVCVCVFDYFINRNSITTSWQHDGNRQK